MTETNRLREAREYVGLSEQEVATFLNLPIETFRRDEQDAGLSGPEWERLSRLYRRPVAWLKGEPADPISVSANLHHLLEDRNLSDMDRREIVAFAEFLAHSRQP